jgi:hypothetical protein
VIYQSIETDYILRVPTTDDCLSSRVGLTNVKRSGFRNASERQAYTQKPSSETQMVPHLSPPNHRPLDMGLLILFCIVGPMHH